MRTFLSALLLVLLPAAAAAKDYRAERFDSRIEVLAGGSLRVTETIVIRFEEGTFTFFYRTIPTRRTDGIEFVSASMDGRQMPLGDGPGQVEVTRKDGLRIEWHFPATPPSTHTFELAYVAKGVAWSDGAHDLVAWRALPSEHDYRIGASRIEVVLPDSPVAPVKIEQRRVGSLSQTPGDARVLVNATDIGKNGWIEVSSAQRPGSVVALAPEWRQQQLRHASYRNPALMAAGLVLLGGLVVLYGMRQSYDPPPRDEATRTFSGPPDAAPPAIAGALTANGSSHLGHAMGALFRLASDGVLTIHEARGAFRSRKFTIARGRPSRPLARHEQALIDAIFSAKAASDREVPLDKARSHLVRHFSAFKKAVAAEMRDAGLYDEGRRQVRRRYMKFGIVLLILAGLAVVSLLPFAERIGGWPFFVPATLVALAVVSFILSAAHTPLSNDGVRRAAAWRAYQKQLRNVPKELTRADWARGTHSPADLLPFAVALGLAAAWSKIFKDGAAQLPPWFHAASAADANSGFVAFVGHGGAGSAGGGGGGGAAGGGGSGAG
jgi:hypothetical protein